MKSQEYDNKLSPHELLFLGGKLIDFEKAILASNRLEAIRLLETVGLSVESAKNISEEILSDPRKYGYCPGGCLHQKSGALSNASNMLMM
jgi:hypothetical protein